MEKKILFMADSHVKSRTWTNNMSLHGDAWQSLRNLNETIGRIEDRPDTLVIGGDWFDSNHPSSEDLAESHDFLDMFKDVWMIRGNHDSVQPPFLTVGSRGRHIRELGYESAVEIAGAAFCGIPWLPSSAETVEALAKACSALKPYADGGRPVYLVLHTSFRHLLEFDGSYRLTAEDIGDVFGDIPIRVLVGDIHTRNTLALPSGGYIHSPGSLYPLSWDKTGERHAVSLVTVTDGSIEDVPTDVRMYAEIDYTDAGALETLVDGMIADTRPGMLPPFIRVNAHGKPLQRPENASLAVLQVVDHADVPEIENASSADDITVSDAVVQELAGDEDLQAMAAELVASADPLATVSGWLDFWKVERI